MAISIRVQKVESLLQRTLGSIFLQQAGRSFDNTMITVVAVRVSPDLGLAKVYLSFLRSNDKEGSLAQVEAKKSVIRGLLGSYVGRKLRRVPDLQFYLDDSVEHVARMNRLLDTLL